MRLLILALLLVAWAIWADYQEAAGCERRGGRVVRVSGQPMRCVGGR